MATHEVTNQVPPLIDYDLARADPLLLPALRRNAAWAEEQVIDFGLALSSAESYEAADLANRNSPQLRTHDRWGNRVDQVDFHPAWHHLVDQAVEAGLHSLPWEAESRPGRQVARAALGFLDSQIEAGHFCPISMTYASVPALSRQSDLGDAWLPLVLTRDYDSSFQPASKKTGVLIGMGMTEKQGGSDVRSNSTRADPVADGYLVTGHKWFTSAPMNDAFLILAQAPNGLSCFLLPRFCPDGRVNQIRIMRLKDKLGNRSNASAELEFDRAHAQLLGEEGRGVASIIEMVNGTRLDCVIGSAALMRQAVTQAIHHCRHRHAFGSSLLDKPAMTAVLADLEIETEAAVSLMVRLAECFDGDNEHEIALRRILVPLAKFLVTKRCTEVVHEALECLGGNGYVEESVMPRLLRESPLNAIWEGSGNVIALDVLRAARTHPEAVDAIGSEFGLAAEGAEKLVSEGTEATARLLTERLGIAVQHELLTRHAKPAVADLFYRTRIGSEGGRFYGAIPASNQMSAIVELAIPA